MHFEGLWDCGKKYPREDDPPLPPWLMDPGLPKPKLLHALELQEEQGSLSPLGFEALLFLRARVLVKNWRRAVSSAQDQFSHDARSLSETLSTVSHDARVAVMGLQQQRWNRNQTAAGHTDIVVSNNDEVEWLDLQQLVTSIPKQEPGETVKMYIERLERCEGKVLRRDLVCFCFPFFSRKCVDAPPFTLCPSSRPSVAAACTMSCWAYNTARLARAKPML